MPLLFELLIAKFRLKLKKVEKATRPFRYDLNQTPYCYTVEVRNRFKGLDLIDRLLDELWTEVHDIVQKTGIEIIPKKKKCKKAKWLSEKVLHIAVKRREAKCKGEKERYTHLDAEFQKIAKRDKKAFLRNQCKEIEEGFLISPCYSLELCIHIGISFLFSFAFCFQFFHTLTFSLYVLGFL